MNLKDYTFIALDLETTGLDRKKDTIIEVAAVRFHLSKDEAGKFQAVTEDERSMLVDPGRKLEENISMITGITDSMLEGKKKWDEVQEKIREFIGDAIIVGHNVLFDTGMLEAHGIDLSSHIILDTFELSEILSQEAESLNLGFLSKHYGFDIAGEHRALDDTRLSVMLFSHYLGLIGSLGERECSIWHEAEKHDESRVVKTLIEITEIAFSDFSFGLSWKKQEATEKDIQSGKSADIEVISLSGAREEELSLIEKEVKKGPLLLLVNSRKQGEWMESILTKSGYSTMVYPEASRFCSIEMLSAWLEKDIWTRKEAILMIKLLSWIGNTETGLLDELKFYGDEHDYIYLFQSGEDEWSSFREKVEKNIEQSQVVIAEVGIQYLDKRGILPGNHTLMMRDIISMGDILRRRKTEIVSFEKIFSLASLLREKRYEEYYDDIDFGVSMIREIYENTPIRPKGLSVFPPGDFGETYFITQGDLWHRGYRWLPFAASYLERAVRELSSRVTDREIIEKKHIESLISSLESLIRVARIKNENNGIIVHITPTDTLINIIPKSIINSAEKLIETQGNGKIILSGYGIHGEKIQKFIKNEYGISISSLGTLPGKTLSLSKYVVVKGGKTVILSTSMKHLRQITQELKGKQDIKNIWTQGLSGGKGKIISLFLNSQEKSVLIGLIDSYTDESFLWEKVDTVYIAKVPFDPPTDSYFLSRTVGMKNNFEEYSAPLSVSKMNTLIGRIKNANPHADIYCLDERLENMLWGKEFLAEFI